MKKTLGMILAGGKGTRLEPLTLNRAKPSVPFGGKYRIIDFPLSNMINSGIVNIFVLTQYESRSLEDHVRKAWTKEVGIGQFIYTLPSIEKRSKKGRYEGTADAIYKNIDRIERFSPDRVAIFGGDHVYLMDISKMIDTHNGGNDLTISAKETKISEDNFEKKNGKKRFKYGVIVTDKNNKVVDFQEKPEKPKEIEGKPGYCWVSMGNYIFSTEVLIDILKEEEGTDFGSHIIPKMKEKKMNLIVHPFKGYWRDVGDLESYYNSNMDLNKDNLNLNLYDPYWKIITLGGVYPPTRLYANSSINTLGEGCDIRGKIENCIISPGVKIGKNSFIRNSIIFNDVEIGEDVRVKNSIIDKGNKLPSGYQIGYDKNQDSKKFHITNSELVVVKKDLLI